MLSLLLWIRLVFCTYNSTVQYLYSIKLYIINTVVYCIPHRRFFTVIYTVYCIVFLYIKGKMFNWLYVMRFFVSPMFVKN